MMNPARDVHKMCCSTTRWPLVWAFLGAVNQLGVVVSQLPGGALIRQVFNTSGTNYESTGNMNTRTNSLNWNQDQLSRNGMDPDS